MKKASDYPNTVVVYVKALALAKSSSTGVELTQVQVLIDLFLFIQVYKQWSEESKLLVPLHRERVLP